MVTSATKHYGVELGHYFNATTDAGMPSHHNLAGELRVNRVRDSQSEVKLLFAVLELTFDSARLGILDDVAYQDR